MARKASRADQLASARELLRAAKTADELRTAQAMLLPLELGLSVGTDGEGHRPVGRVDVQLAHALLQGGASRTGGAARKARATQSGQCDAGT